MSDTPAKKRLRDALEGEDPRWGRSVAAVLYGAIIGSVIVITAQSMSVSPAASVLLGVCSTLLLVIFSIEYVARLWAAPRPLDYALSFWGLVDLLAILPAVLFFFPDTQVLRSLRLFRAFRLLKLLRMRHAVMRLEEAIYASRDELILFTFLAAITLYLSAVGIYHFESEAQPEAFGSIPAAMWWSLATLTTVGYGDVYPVTPGGRTFTALTLLIGLGIVAIPVGVITSALMSAAEDDDTTDTTDDTDPTDREGND